MAISLLYVSHPQVVRFRFVTSDKSLSPFTNAVITVILLLTAAAPDLEPKFNCHAQLFHYEIRGSADNGEKSSLRATGLDP